MCMNRQYTKEQQKEIGSMTMYAKMILQGIKPEDIALDMDTTVEHIEAMIEKIKEINPYLYKQVKAKLAV